MVDGEKDAQAQDESGELVPEENAEGTSPEAAVEGQDEAAGTAAEPDATETPQQVAERLKNAHPDDLSGIPEHNAGFFADVRRLCAHILGS